MPEYKFERYGEIATSIVLNPPTPSETMTVAIAGVPRGGTSMVAAVAEALGVDLGPREELDSDHYEDRIMRNPTNHVVEATGIAPFFVQQATYISQRNHEKAIWGWKNPVGIKSIISLLPILRNPRVIIVFRDMIASIQGEMRFESSGGVTSPRVFPTILEQTQNWLKDNVDFIFQAECPTMLVSYERALNNPELFVTELAAFLSMIPTAEQTAEALSRINPKGGYLVK